MRWLWLTLLLIPMPLLAASAVQAPSSVLEVRYPANDDTHDQRNGYFLALLSLALEETRKDYGDYQLVPVYGLTSQARSISQLSRGLDLDLLWTMTSSAREQQLLPVRIPLLKGLMGYRLLIIRQQDAKKFTAIKTLAQLRQKVAGQGHDWPDVDILRANGIKVVTSVEYESLFKLLESRRFDFMPRGINEPFVELAARPQLGLMVEPHLALYYPAAEYFFVNKDNQTLAARLHEGLSRALQDGRFDELFFHYPANAEAFAKAQLNKRTLIVLKNPLLPKATPLDQKELWFFPPNLPKDELPKDTAPAAH